MIRKWILLACLLSNVAVAAGLTCTGTTQVGGDYRLPNTGRNITPPNTGNAGTINGPGYTCTTTTCVVLFTAKTRPGYGTIPGANKNMTESCTGSWKIGYAVKDVPAGTVYTSPDGYPIYPTTIKGIGVSFNESFVSSYSSYPRWPEVAWMYNNNGQVDTWVDIRVWKTPEFTQPGNLDFTGPVFMQVLSPQNAGDTISSCPNNTADGKLDDRTCVWLSRTLKGSIDFQSGTCNMVSASRTVTMGKYASNIGKSPWQDASFKLQCPVAYGYNSGVSNSYNQYNADGGSLTPNQTKNNSVKIQVVPYTTVINAPQGVFSLDAGGAEGYGIQLAWGMPGEQTTSDTPTKPVAFGSRILASSLNSNFKNGPYTLGGTALATGADGTIRMSARYIRTTGTVQPGPANGKVEIIAAYE